MSEVSQSFQFRAELRLDDFDLNFHPPSHMSQARGWENNASMTQGKVNERTVSATKK